MFHGNLLLPYLISKHFFTLQNHFSFGEVYFELEGNDETTFWLIGGFVTILLIKNSSYILNDFKPSIRNSLLFLFFSLTGILNLMHVSEFLYFNF
jgi:hypothetical protein